MALHTTAFIEVATFFFFFFLPPGHITTLPTTVVLVDALWPSTPLVAAAPIQHRL